MIDYHCHILPGLDDGAHDVSEAIEIARVLEETGFCEVYCTPHCIRGVYDNAPKNVQSAVIELQKEIDRAGIKLKLHPGMEYYLDEYFYRCLTDLQTLGDTQMVLVESPSQTEPGAIKDAIFQIIRRGLTPVFAHPERYDFLSLSGGEKGLFRKVKSYFIRDSNIRRGDDLTLVEALHQQGCLFQGNIGSFAGYYGSRVTHRAQKMYQRNYYFCFGSDAHKLDSSRNILKFGMGAIR